MLTLTDDAVSAIRSLTAQPELPDDTGLRIAASPTAEGPPLAISLSVGPQPGDQLVESEGARVYLDSGAAEALGDKALDANVSAQGEVRFQVTDQ